ncbi:MAG: aldolase/citrate lyase family protein [Leptospira sp.]|nr:aldolase/citrate lyase family protein [Leptospira sp.]
MKSYFFIPANNPKFIEKSFYLKSDFFVLDMEDSILPHQFNDCLVNIKSVKDKEKYFIRFPFIEMELNSSLLSAFSELIHLGFVNYLIPKFSNSNLLIYLKDYLLKIKVEPGKLRFILLIEHPAGLFRLQEALDRQDLNILGLGLGSHDYANTMGMKHTLENISFARNFTLNIAKAFNIQAMDFVSTDLSDQTVFRDECLNGFQLGFDGKFLIHPSQLQTFQSLQFYSEEEVDDAIQVYDLILKMESKEIPIVKYRDKVYEKPHIDRIKKIMEWRANHGAK